MELCGAASKDFVWILRNFKTDGRGNSLSAGNAGEDCSFGLQKFSSFLPGTEENTGQDSQQKLEPFPRNLYQYWGDTLYRNLTAGTADEEEPFYIVNLASAEYSKAILPYVTRPVRVVTCVFGEWIAGKVKVKGTQAKMARGEMVRWMAENQVEDVQELKQFEGLGYRFHPELSSEEEYVFLK